MSSPRREDRGKRQCSGRGEERLFGTEPELNNTMYLEQVAVLLRLTNQRIQPGLTRGQESARRPPACVRNSFHSIIGVRGWQISTFSELQNRQLTFFNAVPMSIHLKSNGLEQKN